MNAENRYVTNAYGIISDTPMIRVLVDGIEFSATMREIASLRNEGCAVEILR